MDQTAKDLLKLMFNPGETVCVSHNEFGYHSVPLDVAMSDEFTVPMIPPTPFYGKTLEESVQYVGSDRLALIALNPIKGYRQDANCTALRSFLIELDVGPLDQQMKYVTDRAMPYSACIFSGGKSLHFLICLDHDLPDIKMYHHLAHWLLGIMTMADEKCKNPSRSIRIPGCKRGDKKQTLVKIGERVKVADLYAWLLKYPNEEPKPVERNIMVGEMDVSKISPWVLHELQNGINVEKGRNTRWFAIAVDFALAGFEEEMAYNFLLQYFQPEHDFKQREFNTAIHSGFKHAYEKK